MYRNIFSNQLNIVTVELIFKLNINYLQRMYYTKFLPVRYKYLSFTTTY